MNDPQRASISHALQVYRDVVLKQNLETVRYLIAEAEPRPASLPAYCNTDEKIQTARIRLFRERYGILHPDLIHVEDIREYIFGDEEVLGEIIERCSLEGVEHGKVNPLQREAWLDAIRAAISELNIPANPLEDTPQEEVNMTPIPELHINPPHHPLHLPPEFLYLSTLARGISGPGLPHYRSMAQFSFLTDPAEALETLQNEGAKSRITVPVRNRPLGDLDFSPLDLTWMEWEIAVGVKSGEGPRGGSGVWIVYCRRISRRGGEGEDGEFCWKLRYGIRDELDYESELFDSLEGFLAWYAHFNEQIGEKLEAVPLGQVM